MEAATKEEFRRKLQAEISLLNSTYPNNEIIEYILSNYQEKLGEISVETFMAAYKAGNKHSGAIISMAMYLWEYEARFGFCLNVLSYILISNGRIPNFKGKKGTKITELDELESVLISNKCQFLSKNGFKMFALNNKQMEKFRNMRNSVAHYNLRIDKEGVITKYNEKNQTWDKLPVIPVQGDLMEFSTDFLSILWSFFFVT